MRDVYDRYKILKAKQLDDNGEPYEKRVTGYDLTPEDEHDTLTAISIRDVFGYDIDDIIAKRASEFHRLLALARASKWNQATPETMRKNLELKRSGRRR